MSEAKLLPNEFDRILSELKRHTSNEFERLKGIVVEKPFDINQASDYLKITRTTLWRRIKNGTIPPSLIHRNEGSIYFLPSELHQFIKSS